MCDGLLVRLSRPPTERIDGREVRRTGIKRGRHYRKTGLGDKIGMVSRARRLIPGIRKAQAETLNCVVATYR